MKVLMVLNQYQNYNGTRSRELAERMKRRGVEVILDDQDKWEKSYQGVDVIVVAGGDGSIVRAARRHLPANLPIIGINLGTIGFLSQIELDDLEPAFKAIERGDFLIDERVMMEIKVEGMVPSDGFYALNDLFLRSVDGQIINIDLRVAGAGNTSYRGDGLIVTTPTGSTAYSLSSGGSIIEPTLELFGITPVSSYLLAQRPIVLSAAHQLELKVTSRRRAYAMLDGQIRLEVDPDQSLYIRKAPWKLKMAHLKSSNFFAAVVEKRLKRMSD